MSLIRKLIVNTNNRLTLSTVPEFLHFFAYTTLATVFEHREAPVVCMKCVLPLRITVYEKQVDNIGIINTFSVLINSYNRIMENNELSVATNSLNRIIESNEFNS